MISRETAALEFLRAITDDEIAANIAAPITIDVDIQTPFPNLLTNNTLLTVTKDTTLEFATPRGSTIVMFTIFPYVHLNQKVLRKETKRQRKLVYKYIM
jgi:hypothetical protein